MVTMLRKTACLCFLLAFLGSLLSLALVPIVKAQLPISVSKEWTKVWINTDSSVNILYNITFSYLSGTPEGYFDVGMPKEGFQVGYAEDPSGAPLQYRDISQGNYYAVEVTLKQPIILNQPITFILYATVPGMVYSDGTNPGNDGVQFFPSTFSSVVGSIGNLRVEMVLPPGVQTSEVKYPTGLPFDNVFVSSIDNNRTTVYWERTAWPPAQEFEAGVSFPAKYVTQAPNFLGILPLVFVAIFLIFLFLVVGVIVVKRGSLGGYLRTAYESPRLSIEALGANRSLTAVEAGLVIGLKPTRVLTMVLYGLLLKHLVTIVETEPLLKLGKLEKSGGESAYAPRYYESDYLEAVKPDGTLDEKALVHTYRSLVDSVNQKLRGYSREDTVNYYKSIVDRAWAQVTQAGTPELKGDALDKNLDWLLADENFDDHLRTAFPPTVVVYPNPAWWWYRGGPTIPSTRTTQPSAPSKTASLPGQDFANNVVRGLESTSNNMVRDMQAFANMLIPFAAAPKEGSIAGRPSCVCACHACACACACVSCACACAGGGGH